MYSKARFALSALTTALLTAVALDLPASEQHQKARDAYGKLPLAFVPNAGQTDPRVRFSAQAGRATFHFTKEEAAFAFRKGSPGQAGGVVLRLAFLGANPETTIEGQKLGTGKVNYLIGSDPSEWRTGLPTYGQVVYRDLWPGVDMVFRGDGSRLKYDFIVRPGAKVEDIQLAYRGAEGLSVDEAGQLLIGTPMGTLTDVRPVSYQEIGGRRVPVESHFLLRPEARDAYGFAVGDYDPRQPLVIDPGLAYSTFLGGSQNDSGNPIAVDATGNAYITGETSSTASSFPVTSGAYDTLKANNRDAFVAKLNAAGSALVYATYLGGNGDDIGFGIAVDTAGNAYVTGETRSAPGAANPPDATTFPLLGAFDGTQVDYEAFVTKLNPAGNMLLYSSYLGGENEDRGRSIAVEALSGIAYVTGETKSLGVSEPTVADRFPTTLGAFDNTKPNGSDFDVFVTKVNTTQTGAASLVYSTFLGGSGADRGLGIVIDVSGNAYVTGETNASPFLTPLLPPPAPPGFDTSISNVDAFVTKLNSSGNGVLYSTFLGGSGNDRGYGIAIDAVGNAFVTGETSSNPLYPPAGGFDTTYGSNVDAFVLKLNTGGTTLGYWTYLGGTAVDRGFGVAVDGSGNAYVTGETSSLSDNNTPFPTTVGAFDISSNGNFDAFVSKLDPTGAALLYSTYLGGSNEDRGFGIAGDTAGSAYVTGLTRSGGTTSPPKFPTTSGASDTSHNGSEDAFVTKLDMLASAPATLTLSPATDSNPVGTSHTVTATLTQTAANAGNGNLRIRFSRSGVNGTGTGNDTTDDDGEATFSYTGTNAGPDTITAFADVNNNGVQDAGEPFGTANKMWLAPAVCGNGVVEGTEQCDQGVATNGTLGSCCSLTCTFKTAGTICNPGSGDVCDPAETCTGSSAACPADTVAPSTTVCNPGSGDVCDPDQHCTGTADQACPVDVVAGPTTTCRPGSGDVCDPAEVCTGVANATCPVDIVAPSALVCRLGSGDVCDPNETCTGTAGQACPADVVAPSTTVCNPGSGDVCDPDEMCTGTAGQACPLDTVAGPTTTCRTGSGDVCDPDEVCTNVPDATCPGDIVAPSALVCRLGSGDVCDPNETCTGTAGEACPADVVAPPSTVCNAGSGDVCDPVESCTGNAGQMCPTDVIAPPSLVCNPGSGDLCDPDELCTGLPDQACPTDTVAPSTVVCNPGSADVCDPDEHCTGTAEQACPTDTVAPSTTVCHPSSGDACDPEEHCTGTADQACPADAHASDGTACTEDENLCTGDECQAGLCTHPLQPPGTSCESSSDTECDNGDTCDDAGNCLENQEPDGTTCNADDVECTSDTCQSGQCVAGTPAFQKMHGSGDIGTKPNQAHFGFNVKSPQPKGELNYHHKATNAKIHGKVIHIFYTCDCSTKFRIQTKNHCEYDITVTGNPEEKKDNIEFFSIDYVAGTGSGCADEHNAGSCVKGKIKCSKHEDDDDCDEDDH